LSQNEGVVEEVSGEGAASVGGTGVLSKIQELPIIFCPVPGDLSLCFLFSFSSFIDEEIEAQRLRSFSKTPKPLNPRTEI